MIQYLFLKKCLDPCYKRNVFCLLSARLLSFALTRSFVPKKVQRKCCDGNEAKYNEMFLSMLLALFPKYSTSGSVKVLMVSVPAVARRFLKILNTDLSYGSCVISAFSAEYGTLIAV